VNRFGWPRGSAALGALIWLVVLVTADIPWRQRVLLLAPLVLVPLALAVLDQPSRHGRRHALWSWAVALQPAAAAGAAWSVVLEPGGLAGCAAVPWAVVCALVAAWGLRSLLRRGLLPVEELAIDVGCVQLLVGAVWLVIARFGLDPLAHGGTLVELTAVHFHFAGFALPVLVGLAGRGLRSARTVYAWSTWGILVGIPLTAVGIGWSPSLELGGAILLAGSAVVHAILLLGFPSARGKGVVPNLLLAVSGLSLVWSMRLAIEYADAAYGGGAPTDMVRMAAVHGSLNAIGVCLFGLLARSMRPPSSRVALEGRPWSRLGGGRIGADYFERRGLTDRNREARGLLDRMDVWDCEGLRVEELDPSVRRFFEDTAAAALHVRPVWAWWARPCAAVMRWVADRVGQLALPRSPGSVTGRVVALQDDPRPGARAWVRTGTDGAVLVSAYASHRYGGRVYQDVVLPLPIGNLTCTFLPEQDHHELVLTSASSSRSQGDEGAWWVTRWFRLRLPLVEQVMLWPSSDEGPVQALDHGVPDAQLLARHRIWWWGLHVLRLDYAIRWEDA